MSEHPSPIVIVTGSNTGLGFGIVRALLTTDHPCTIFLCSRVHNKGQEAAEKLRAEAKNGSEVIALQLDLEDDASIERFVEHVSAQFGRVDVLINNAAVNLDPWLARGKVTVRQAWNQAYNTNVTGTHILTDALMPLLFRSASGSSVTTRVIFVSSGVGSHAWHSSAPEVWVNQSPDAGWPKPASAPEGIPAYRSSKAALGMAWREWCRVLANDPIKCHLVCPGLIATNLGGSTPEQLRAKGANEPEVPANFIREVVEGKYDEYAGLGGKLVSLGKPMEW